MNPRFAITPEMVQRAYDAVPDKLLFKSTIEAMLDAAINPPSEPEVTVTDEMMKAGFKAVSSFVARTQTHVGRFWYDGVAEAYRAMRKLEPKA